MWKGGTFPSLFFLLLKLLPVFCVPLPKGLREGHWGGKKGEKGNFFPLPFYFGVAGRRKITLFFRLFYPNWHFKSDRNKNWCAPERPPFLGPGHSPKRVLLIQQLKKGQKQGSFRGSFFCDVRLQNGVPRFLFVPQQIFSVFQFARFLGFHFELCPCFLSGANQIPLKTAVAFFAQ